MENGGVNMNIVIINGSGGVGKSTFIKCCSEVRNNVYELSMIDFVVYVAKEIGWNGKKDEKGRKFLSDLKDCIDNYDKSIIYNTVCDRMDDISFECHDDDVEPIFFINARSPEDIDYFVNNYNAVTLLISNPRIKRINTNHADKNVDCYMYDYEIVNNKDLDDLTNKAKNFLYKFSKR